MAHSAWASYFVLGIFGTLLYFIWTTSRRAKKFPPGPRGFPILGNIFQVPLSRQHLKFNEWAKEYGDIVYLKLGTQHFVVLNSVEATDELLSNRSVMYSSRNSPYTAHEILRDGQFMLFLPSDHFWKTTRKSMQLVTGPAFVQEVHVLQELESRVTLYDLLQHGDRSIVEKHVEGPHGETPNRHWFAIFRRNATSIMLSLSFGGRVEQLENNKRLHRIYEDVDKFVAIATPGAYLADVIPFLRKLPDFLSPWRIAVQKMHNDEYQFLESLRADSKGVSEESIMKGGFVNRYLRARAEAGVPNTPGKGLTDDGLWMRDKAVLYNGIALVEAGSDTITTVSETFVLLMLSNPHALRKAREEIDRIVGSDRMPMFEDEPRLPYLVACIKETMRRRPPTPIGIPHATDRDDVYNGYFIPKGTTVIGNMWALHMDPKRYYNPMAFDPERFYTEGQPTRWGSGPNSAARDHYTFGWGRRFCPGNQIAEASLFILLSRLVWGIDFAAPVDQKMGHSILPDVADDKTWSEAFVSVPHIFPVSFKARSEKHAQIIQKSFESAQDEWWAAGLGVDVR